MHLGKMLKEHHQENYSKNKKSAQIIFFAFYLFGSTPYSMNSLFSEFFKEFPGVILEVCETIWGSFGRCFGRILRGKLFTKEKKNSPNLIHYYLPI